MISRRSLFVLILVIALGVTALFSLLLGSNHLDPATTLRVLLHDDGSEAATIVREVRLPRTVLGILVGLSLGAAGTLMQGHTRNPLAEPGLLGVTAGAAFTVVIAAQTLAITAPGGQVWFGLLGALIATAAVFGIATAGGSRVSPVPMALAGAAVTALLTAFTSIVVLGDQETLDVYRRWAVGSISGRETGVIGAVLPFMLVGMALAAFNTRALNVVSLGEDTARGLGQSVTSSRLIGLAAVTLLAGSATAAAGPISFLGLIVPHLARAVTGPDNRWLLPCSALAGAILLLAGDIVGRLIGGAGEVQVGITLALVGGVLFVFIARRGRLVRL